MASGTSYVNVDAVPEPSSYNIKDNQIITIRRQHTLLYSPQYTAEMATMVENPANTVPPHRAHLSSSIPTVESLEGFATEGSDEYSTFKKLQRQLEYIQLQEEYIKDEQRYVWLAVWSRRRMLTPIPGISRESLSEHRRKSNESRVCHL